MNSTKIKEAIFSACAGGTKYSDAVTSVATQFGVTEEEVKMAMNPNGTQYKKSNTNFATQYKPDDVKYGIMNNYVNHLIQRDASLKEIISFAEKNGFTVDDVVSAYLSRKNPGKSFNGVVNFSTKIKRGSELKIGDTVRLNAFNEGIQSCKIIDIIPSPRGTNIYLIKYSTSNGKTSWEEITSDTEIEIA